MTARCTCTWRRPEGKPKGWAKFRVKADPKCPEHAEPEFYQWADGRLHDAPDNRDAGKHGGCG